MVQNTSGIPPFKLLLLKDAFKVLHPLLQVPHVSRQMTVEKAHWVAEDCHPRTDAAFIPLKVTGKDKQHSDKLCRVKDHQHTLMRFVFRNVFFFFF